MFCFVVNLLKAFTNKQQHQQLQTWPETKQQKKDIKKILQILTTLKKKRKNNEKVMYSPISQKQTDKRKKMNERNETNKWMKERAFVLIC